MFCFSPSAVVLQALDNFPRGQWNKRNYYTSIYEMFCAFLREKLFERNFSHWMSAKQLTKQRRCKKQVPIKGGNFNMELTHLCGFWLVVSFFFFLRVKNIVCSSDRLELICEWKLYDEAFWWVFLSMHIIKNGNRTKWSPIRDRSSE